MCKFVANEVSNVFIFSIFDDLKHKLERAWTQRCNATALSEFFKIIIPPAYHTFLPKIDKAIDIITQFAFNLELPQCELGKFCAHSCIKMRLSLLILLLK